MLPEEWTAVKELVENFLDGLVSPPGHVEYVCEILDIEFPLAD